MRRRADLRRKGWEPSESVCNLRGRREGERESETERWREIGREKLRWRLAGFSNGCSPGKTLLMGLLSTDLAVCIWSLISFLICAG